MLLNVSISLGELLDKISILLIKEKQINNSQKQIHIKEELSLLNEALEKSIQRELVKEYIIELVNINTSFIRDLNVGGFLRGSNRYPHPFIKEGLPK
mgnify:CR=1 FL=1